MLNGHKALKEALVTKGDSVVDRPHLPLQDEIAKGLGEQLNTQTQTCFSRLNLHVRKLDFKKQEIMNTM